MQGYEVTSLSVKTQELIKNEGLDANQDGLINKDNGELAELLSRTGKSDINELCYDSWFRAKLGDFGIGGILTLCGAEAFRRAYDCKPAITKSFLKASAEAEFIRNNGFPHNDKVLNSLMKTKVSIKKCVQNIYKSHKRAIPLKLVMMGTLCAAGLGILGVAGYMFAKKPWEHLMLSNSSDYTPVERQRSVYEDEFRGMFGEDADLAEYTPQKGEYWISILKAKYGVDNATAQRMAHDIKHKIYGDATAAKQPPVMYLPQQWVFEGKTYQYNVNSVPERTENFSDDVQTEMGEMNKTIRY